MSTVTSQSNTEDALSSELPGEPRPRRRRRRALISIVVVVLVVAAGILVITDPFGGHGPSKPGKAAARSLATVTQRDLSSHTNVDGTLGYTGSYSVVSQARGTITALPDVGQIITQGQALYEVNATPIVLLYGATPAYRSLSAGMTGPDVAQLNADLVGLGYASSSQLDPNSDKFSSATATALKKLQGDLRVNKTGSLALGDAVFLPSEVRITEVSTSLGASAGGPVLKASSTTRIVTVALDAAQQSDVKVGDQVTVTLPGKQTTPGVVWFVGTVATGGSSGSSGSSNSSSSSDSSGSSSSSDSSGSSGSSPTVSVEVAPTDPAATGNLDQAPVQVSIVTDTVKDALVVPVTALVGRAGGYAIETVDARGGHHLVPVTLGLFDDADGLVQVTGKGVTAGQHVVVPST